MLDTAVLAEPGNFPWLEPLLTLLAIFAAGAVVVWQVRAQFRQNRELQIKEKQDDLWLSIYREISDRNIQSGQVQLEAISYARNILFDIGLGKDSDYPGVPTSFFEKRSMTFTEVNSDLLSSIIRLIGMLERNEIMCPELKIFRIALSNAHRELMTKGSKLFERYLRILPVELPQTSAQGGVTNVINQSLPDDEAYAELKRLTKEYEDAGMNLTGFLFDLNVESQNLLLGKLFSHRVPKREPVDPNVKVIVTSPPEEVEALREHFEKNTRTN